MKFLRWSAFFAALAACSESNNAVVGGRTDATVDTADAMPDVSPDVALDVAPDVSPDVTVDVPVDTGPARCFSNSECAGNPMGSVCDAARGRCVQCLAAADTCDPAQHCDDASNTCVAGCRSDEGCAGSDAGVARRCDTATHACVECVRDEHCAAGSLCVGSVCVPGCNDTRACPTGQSCCGGACIDPQRNTAHCGACNRACMTANASRACTNGTCTVATCTAPFGDCDGSATNGCEVNTLTDASHCGGCGMACAPRANATASCAAGRCDYACSTGFADCDGDPSNGCEVDTRASASHCGACGRACSLPNATAACVMGACAVSACAAGFGDCDGNASNGCETDTRVSTTHCGGCGMACAGGDNALPGCVTGRCVIACVAGFADCDGSAANGCEVDTRTSAGNCGGCGRSCSFMGAGASCAGGACVLGACDAGLANCDGAMANGCETDTRTSAANCGMCGRACPTPAHAAPTCAGSTCGYTCLAGWGDCDGSATNGCETDLAVTAAHCGRCGNACGSGVCAGSVCQAPTCTDGVRNGTESDVDCGGGACPVCGLCRTCRVNADCAAGTCGEGNLCSYRTEVSIDWLTTCHGPDNTPTDVTVTGVPAGSYTVTALASGGTVWSTTILPGQGWFWNITCENLAVPELATTSGVYYADAAAAFAALPRTTSTVSFAGGTLRCYFSDSACRDNRGGVRFRMDRRCP